MSKALLAHYAQVSQLFSRSPHTRAFPTGIPVKGSSQERY